MTSVSFCFLTRFTSCLLSDVFQGLSLTFCNSLQKTLDQNQSWSTDSVLLMLLRPLTSCCVSSVSQVSTEGALSDSTLPLTVFVSRAPVSGPDVERVSTGTKFALDLWLKSLETPDPSLTSDPWPLHPAGHSGSETYIFCTLNPSLCSNKTPLKHKRLSDSSSATGGGPGFRMTLLPPDPPLPPWHQ